MQECMKPSVTGGDGVQGNGMKASMFLLTQTSNDAEFLIHNRSDSERTTARLTCENFNDALIEVSNDWNDYLEIAKDFKTKTDGLPQSNLNEAMQRTALSRAYYSAYHLAVNYAKVNFNYNPDKPGPNKAHSDIRSEYGSRMSDPDHQEVAKILAKMHKARIDSDYKSDSLGKLEPLLTSILLDADKVKCILI